MKKIINALFFSASILVLFTLASCEGDGIPISIPQEIDQTFVVPANNDSSFVLSKEVSGNFDSILLANNIKRDDISFIVVTGAKFGQVDSLGIVSTSWFEFDTVKVLIGNIDRPAAFDSVIAYIPDIFSASLDEGGFTGMTINSTDLDLVPYITKPKYRMTITGKSKNTITKDLYYKLKVKMNIGVIAI